MAEVHKFLFDYLGICLFIHACFGVAVSTYNLQLLIDNKIINKFSLFEIIPIVWLGGVAFWPSIPIFYAIHYTIKEFSNWNLSTND